MILGDLLNDLFFGFEGVYIGAWSMMTVSGRSYQNSMTSSMGLPRIFITCRLSPGQKFIFEEKAIISG